MSETCLRARLFVLTGVVMASGGFAQQPIGPLTQRDLSIVRLGNPDQLKTPVRVPKGYAVVIGISAYQNLGEPNNLKFAEKDAENLYQALISKEAGNIEFENVKKLIGPQATLANIRDVLEVWLPLHAQETDRVVVYFVGHGATDEEGRGYLVPYDMDPARTVATAYPMQQLGSVFSTRVKARWKILLLDACHSGKVTVDSTPGKVNESLRGLPQGFLTVTSSRAAQRSFEDPELAGGNGVFTYFLVRGWLGEADVNPRDGVVSADELVEYVKREVQMYTKARGVQQNPMEFGDFPDDMVLGFSPKQREQLSDNLTRLSNGGIVVQSNLDSVEVLVDEQRYGVASPDKPLSIPGLSSGLHKVRGLRMGYESVTVEVNVIPGGQQTVSLRLLLQRTVKPVAKVLYDQGIEIWERSRSPDLRKAADLLSRALREEPNYSQAALALCRVQARVDTGAALKSCLRAIDIDPDYVEARAMSGELLMNSGDYPEAVRQLQRGRSEDPHSTFLASLLAEAFYLADRPQEAEETATRAIGLDSSSGQAFLIRGEARRALNSFDDAIEDYHRALNLQEFRSGTLRTVAFWIVGTGMRKHRSGTQILYRSQKTSAYYGLCAAEIGRANYARAVKYCRDALATEHDDPETFLLLAECYAGLFTRENRRDYLLEAKDSLDSVLRINPNIEQAAVLRKKRAEIVELLGQVK